MADRLIVPVDGSTIAWKAVDVAAALAKRMDASVHIVQVEDEPNAVMAVRRHMEQNLDELGPIDVPVELEVLLDYGSVASALDGLIERFAGSVIVMSSSGRGRSAAIVGSVAEDVLLRTFGPIVLVGPHVVPDDFSGPVVVTVDGSATSEAALPLAAAWAIELGSEPWVVTSIPAGRSPATADVTDSVYPARLAHELADASDHPVQFEQLHGHDPDIAVAEFADGIDASLIVAASHGRIGLARLAVGSTVSGFVRHATCPVLVVRSLATG